MRFEGKRVLVTGAAHGIGFAVARAFHAEGARVALNDIDRDALQAAVTNLGDQATAHPADVGSGRAVMHMVREVREHLGGVDVLVSNAGIYPSHPFLEIAEEQWDRVLDINAKGAFLVGQAVARAMVAAERPGVIITIASGSARFAREGAAHYCASKAAMVMLTRVMALELARHRIRVNAVSPGLVNVSGGPPLSESYKRAMTDSIPWGRMGTPEDVANVVLLIADPSAEYVTGQVIPVDGGLSAGRYGIPPSE